MSRSELVKYMPPKYREAVVIVAPPLLGEVAMLFRGMPYGDLVRFAEAVGADPQFIWKWATGHE